MLLFAHSFVASHSKYIHTLSCLRLALHKNHTKLKIKVAFYAILRCCVLDVWHTPSHLRLVLHKNHSKLKINVAFCVILRCCGQHQINLTGVGRWLAAAVDICGYRIVIGCYRIQLCFRPIFEGAVVFRRKMTEGVFYNLK